MDAGDTGARIDLPAAGFHLEGVLRKHMIVKVRGSLRRPCCLFSSYILLVVAVFFAVHFLAVVGPNILLVCVHATERCGTTMRAACC